MNKETHPSGIYLHIPFCRHLCGYCAFAKTDKGAFSENYQLDYIKALEWEWNFRSEHIDTKKISTLYIGGGTPSRLEKNSLERLLLFLNKKIDFNQLNEITFEINPEDLIERPQILDQLNTHGINRISMGIQTFQEKGIQVLERKTSAKQNHQALDLLKSHFKGRLSLDFILAWPGQTLNDLENDLNEIQNLKAGHLSTYLLNYEPGTRLERDRIKGRVQELDDDLTADIWERFQAFCHELKYQHYEISSFSLENQESQHNTKTWDGFPYLGIGAGAVSRIKQTRWTNLKTIEGYIQHCTQHKDPIFEREELTSKTLWQEDLLLALRHNKGLNLNDFKSKHQLDFLEILDSDIQLGLKENNWTLNNDTLIMTPKGWQLFDYWLSDWMLKLEEA